MHRRDAFANHVMLDPGRDAALGGVMGAGCLLCYE
jgi:hypothetical protein